MKNVILRKLVAFALPIAALAVAGTATANTIAGFAGTARLNAERDCFSESWGSAVNVCSGDRVINYSLAVFEEGNHSASIYTSASAVSTANVCRTGSISPSGSASASANYPWQLGNGKVVNVGPILVPANGAMWVACVVPQGGRVNTVSYFAPVVQ